MERRQPLCSRDDRVRGRCDRGRFGQILRGRLGSQPRVHWPNIHLRAGRVALCFSERMSFFVDLGDGRYRATERTTGPWDPRHQHAGPPSALLTGTLERTAPRDDMVLAWITVEMMGAERAS